MNNATKERYREGTSSHVFIFPIKFGECKAGGGECSPEIWEYPVVGILI